MFGLQTGFIMTVFAVILYVVFARNNLAAAWPDAFLPEMSARAQHSPRSHVLPM